MDTTDKPFYRADANPSPMNLYKTFEDIDLLIDLAQIAEEYMDMDYAQFTRKFYAYDMDTDEQTEGFTPEERKELAGALVNLAERLRAKADDLLSK